MQDPKLLYAIEGVSAYQLGSGREEPLTPSGPQTLSLLMVPTSSGFADPNTVNTEEDFYLHLHLPPELDLPMPATTQIYHQPPTSYLIPRWDLGPESGAFTRLEFPAVKSRPGVQEDVDTFETILAQCTAFLERAQAPVSSKKKESDAARAKAREAAGEELPPYNPADYEPGQAYAAGSSSAQAQQQGGRIVLVDQEDGSVIGELGEGFQVVEDGAVQPGSKDPVMVALPQDGSQNIAIGPAPQEYVGKDMHPAYKKSTIVSGASKASQLLVTTSDFVTRTMSTQADNFTKSTQPVKPVTFQPTTHEHIRRINTLSTKAAGLSTATVGTISKYAQNFGASVAKRKDGSARGYDKDGNPIDTYKPGVLNKSLMAFNTVVDGVEQAGRNLLTGASSSATQVVGHRWGPEAGEVAGHIGGGVKNVGLVYIDVTGVSRRAILKSVAKGMVVGNVKGGGQVIVGGEEGATPDGKQSGRSTPQSVYGDNASMASGRPLLNRNQSSQKSAMGQYK
ncbi:Spartin-like protein [Emericellopsis cladophorae]|uniref:Spartin-like protein n=1 Tax=Emericellopsis cladophorae TaxID=2686198 RepID=A0A9P9XXX9_9HYPO|nr:Spartin-like protein [Emericellopsis cladophorae]KAI6779908.1 Spartin-like protein [Emericellopsis cladophorae]